jgi:hypothetical protein
MTRVNALQAHERRGEPRGHHAAGQIAQRLAVVGARRVHQQHRVAGGRRVEHHEAPPRLADDTREGVKHGDLLGAGRGEIFAQQRLLRGRQAAAPREHHLLDVGLGLDRGVDAAHLEAVHLTGQRLDEVRRRVGRREVHREAALRQRHRQRRRDGRLAHAALPHHHHQPLRLLREHVDQRLERLHLRRRARCLCGSGRNGRPSEQRPQRREADGVERLQTHLVAR